MRRSLIGRADLADALAALGEHETEREAALAAILGYYRREPLRTSSEDSLPGATVPGTKAESTSDSPPATKDMPFWRLEGYEAVEPLAVPSPPRTRTPQDALWRHPPTELPHDTPLESRPRLLRRLRAQVTGFRTTHTVDLGEMVARLSRAEWLGSVPWIRQRSWGTHLHLVVDRSPRLAPYARDQAQVLRWLRPFFPHGALTVSRLGEGDRIPTILWPEAQRDRPLMPQPGSRILALSDLGCLARNRTQAEQPWLTCGRRWCEQGIPLVALVPTLRATLAPALRRLWTILEWGTGQGGPSFPPDRTETALQYLWALAAPAIRLEVDLVRALRRLWPEGRLDPGWEARFWEHPGMHDPHHAHVATPKKEFRKDLLQKRAFASLPTDLQRAVLTLLRTWHGTLHPQIWFEEAMSLDASTRNLLDPDDLEDARAALERFVSRPDPEWIRLENAAWFQGLTERFPADATTDLEYIQSLHKGFRRNVPSGTLEVPGWLDPGVDPPKGKEQLWRLVQTGDRLSLQGTTLPYGLEHPTNSPGSPWAWIRSSRNEILVEGLNGHARTRVHSGPMGSVAIPKGARCFVLTDLERMQFGQIHRPSWATAIGRDRFGLWGDWEFRGVRQRFRWIPPGRFWMGSPEEEEGRYSDEGPRHEVELTQGYWLFDTPCTQALWEAVMGSNPSWFEGPDRPVKMVSWHECQGFLKQVQIQVPGLRLGLPTEAQWEYACRAGSTGARYAEDLDAIAWYGENSGDETHPVKEKQPNAWGLFDMLGNVLEWCKDGKRPYKKGMITNPKYTTKDSAVRVLRGGDWHGDARLARAAYRDAYGPGDRIRLVGFRCSSSG